MTVVAPDRVVVNGDAPKRRSKIVAVLVLLVLGFGAWAVAERGAGGPIPEGWTRVGSLAHLRATEVVFNQDLNVFLVYESPATRPVALSGVSPHSANGPEQLLFCRPSEYFQVRQPLEKFDRFGRYALGPASRGMDRFAVMVLGGDVYIDKRQLFQGPPRFDPKPLEPRRALGVCGGEDPKDPGFATVVTKFETIGSD